MACAILGCEYIQSNLHKIVATILLAVALKLRSLAWHKVSFLDGVCFACIESLKLDVKLWFLVAWVQIVGKEYGTLLVLAYIVDGAVAALVWRNQTILVALKNHRLHVVVVLYSLLHKLVVVSRERLEVDVEAKLA